MKKSVWQDCKEKLNTVKELRVGRNVEVKYHWNFGRTPDLRNREVVARLLKVDDRGIIIHFIKDKRISYKSIKSIEACSPEQQRAPFHGRNR